MRGKLDNLARRFDVLQAEIAKPEVIADHERYRDLMREYSDLEPIIGSYGELCKLEKEIARVKWDMEKANIKYGKFVDGVSEELKDELSAILDRLP